MITYVVGALLLGLSFLPGSYLWENIVRCRDSRALAWFLIWMAWIDLGVGLTAPAHERFGWLVMRFSLARWVR